MPIQSKAQRFAEVVFPRVSEASEQQWAGKYKTLCKKAGSLVRNSGLMQMLAFCRAKGQRDAERHHECLLEHLQQELAKLKILPEGNDLLEYIQQTAVPEYMYITREVLHLLNWHKRLADTLITRKEES